MVLLIHVFEYTKYFLLLLSLGILQPLSKLNLPLLSFLSSLVAPAVSAVSTHARALAACYVISLCARAAGLRGRHAAATQRRRLSAPASHSARVL